MTVPIYVENRIKELFSNTKNIDGKLLRYVIQPTHNLDYSQDLEISYEYDGQVYRGFKVDFTHVTGLHDVLGTMWGRGDDTMDEYHQYHEHIKDDGHVIYTVSLPFIIS